jgi:hypothetical protein
MAKNKISEYSSTAANNTDVANINIAEGCSPSNINNAIRAVMSHLKNFQDGSSGDSLTIGGALTSSGTLTQSGTLNVTGGLQLDGSAGTSGQVIVSQGSGTPVWGSGFPSGGIIMWSGTIAAIPSGWYLCDGNNGTPDLRNRFIIGANADDGGAAKTNVTGSATQSGGSKDAIVVDHNHSITDAGHSHTYIGDAGRDGTDPAPLTVPIFDVSVGTVTFTFAPTATTGITIDSEGSSGTNANLPPYYALAFIMKS